jgi:hypothetical protein
LFGGDKIRQVIIQLEAGNGVANSGDGFGHRFGRCRQTCRCAVAFCRQPQAAKKSAEGRASADQEHLPPWQAPVAPSRRQSESFQFALKSKAPIVLLFGAQLRAGTFGRDFPECAFSFQALAERLLRGCFLAGALLGQANGFPFGVQGLDGPRARRLFSIARRLCLL